MKRIVVLIVILFSLFLVGCGRGALEPSNHFSSSKEKADYWLQLSEQTDWGYLSERRANRATAYYLKALLEELERQEQE